MWSTDKAFGASSQVMRWSVCNVLPHGSRRHGGTGVLVVRPWTSSTHQWVSVICRLLFCLYVPSNPLNLTGRNAVTGDSLSMLQQPPTCRAFHFCPMRLSPLRGGSPLEKYFTCRTEPVANPLAMGLSAWPLDHPAPRLLCWLGDVIRVAMWHARVQFANFEKFFWWNSAHYKRYLGSFSEWPIDSIWFQFYVAWQRNYTMKKCPKAPKNTVHHTNFVL